MFYFFLSTYLIEFVEKNVPEMLEDVSCYARAKVHAPKTNLQRVISKFEKGRGILYKRLARKPSMQDVSQYLIRNKRK